MLDKYCNCTCYHVKILFIVVVLVVIFNAGPSEAVQKWLILHDRFWSTCCISNRVSCNFLKIKLLPEHNTFDTEKKMPAIIHRGLSVFL